MTIFLQPLSLPRLALYQYTTVGADDRVLDIGTGAGFAARRWGLVARSVVGVDISQPIIDMATQAINTESVATVRFECADACAPEFAAQYREHFDLVTSSDVFEHVEDPDTFVQSIGSALRPGGRAILTFPNETNGHGQNSFASSATLIDLFTRHGLRVEVRVLCVTEWASAVHQLLWRSPLLIFRRLRRTHAGETARPQVMHETWYFHAAGRPRRAYVLVNAYARCVEAVMGLAGPIFRASSAPAGDIADRRVLIRAWRL